MQGNSWNQVHMIVRGINILYYYDKILHTKYAPNLFPPILPPSVLPVVEIAPHLKQGKWNKRHGA